MSGSGVKKAAKPGKGGRPSQARAEQIGEEILTIAMRMFLSEGYGATSIEAIAQQAGISKRTFYARFANKADLFKAVVNRLVTQLRPKQVAPLFTGGTLEEILLRLAAILLRAALMPDALALHRLMIAEAHRFPELTAILDAQGARQEAITRIAALLEEHAPSTSIGHEKAMMAAEQFMQMVVSIPQRRALGLGVPMSPEALAEWATDAVHLFLNGYGLLR